MREIPLGAENQAAFEAQVVSCGVDHASAARLWEWVRLREWRERGLDVALDVDAEAVSPWVQQALEFHRDLALLAETSASGWRVVAPMMRWDNPSGWRERSARVLAGYRLQQWQALNILWFSQVAIDGLEKPPATPDALQIGHFVPWDRLGGVLLKLRDTNGDRGTAQFLTYEESSGKTAMVAFFTRDPVSDEPNRTHRESPLEAIAVLAAEVRAHTGVSEAQAVSFLLSDAPLDLPRLEAAVSWPHERSEPTVTFVVSSGDVTVDDLRRAYRTVRGYLKESGAERASTEGLAHWLQEAPLREVTPTTPFIAGREQRMAELIDFVELHLDRGERWAAIYEAWNASHPSRPYGRLHSLQQTYYKTSKRLADRRSDQQEKTP